jgi:hypothetical protein
MPRCSSPVTDELFAFARFDQACTNRESAPEVLFERSAPHLAESRGWFGDLWKMETVRFCIFDC